MRYLIALIFLFIFQNTILRADSVQNYSYVDIGLDVSDIKYSDKSGFPTLIAAHHLDDNFVGGVSVYFNFSYTDSLTDISNSGWIRFTTANGLNSNNVEAIEYYSSGGFDTIIVGTSSAGINIIKNYGTVESKTKTNSGLKDDTINDLLLVGSECYIATNSGVNKYEIRGDSITSVPVIDSFLDGKIVKAMALSNSDSTIWFLTDSAIYYYDNNSVVLVKSINFTVNKGAAEVSHNQLWFGTTSGLKSYDIKTNTVIEYYPEYGTSVAASVSDIASFKENYILIATKNAGVMRYDLSRNKWDAQYAASSSTVRIASNNVQRIFNEKDEVLFLATDNNFSKVTITAYNTPSTSTDISVVIYPNPYISATGQCIIEFYSPVSGTGSAVIYNLFGEKEKTLLNSSISAGINRMTWQGKNDAGNEVLNGVYVVKVKVQGGSYKGQGINRVAVVK